MFPGNATMVCADGNMAFAAFPTTGLTLPDMKEAQGRHPSAERLYRAAKEAQGITTPAALAAALEEDSQVITNWGRRGVSVPGALKAQRVFGYDANWILTGEGAVEAGWPFSHALRAQLSGLAPAKLASLEIAMWAHMDQEPPQEVRERLRQARAQLESMSEPLGAASKSTPARPALRKA